MLVRILVCGGLRSYIASESTHLIPHLKIARHNHLSLSSTVLVYGVALLSLEITY